MVNLPVKAAIEGSIGSTIWFESFDNAATNITQYAGDIAAAPGRKLIRIANRLKNINPDHTQYIKEILLDNQLTVKEKVEFFKLKIDYVLKNLKGNRRFKDVKALFN